MVDVAKFFLEFTQKESWRQCVPCREGTKHMLLLLGKDSPRAKGHHGGPDTLEGLAHMGEDMSLCGLGQTAPNPVLPTLQVFPGRVRRPYPGSKSALPGACAALLEYRIIQEACKKCGICARNCPVKCIPGDRNSGYLIETDRCIRCGTCFEKCPFGAIEKK